MKVTKLSLLLATVVASVSVGTIHAQTAKKAVAAKPVVVASSDALVFELGLLSNKAGSKTNVNDQKGDGLYIAAGASQQIFKIDADQTVDLGALLTFTSSTAKKDPNEFSQSEFGVRIPVTYRYKLDDFALIGGAYVGYNLSQSGKQKASGVETNVNYGDNGLYFGLTVGGTYQVSDYRFKLAYNLNLGDYGYSKEVGAVTLGVDWTGVSLPKLF